MFNPVIFREYDIRGVVDQDYDEDFAHQLGAAYVSYVSKHFGLSKPTITVGHDARLSSPKLYNALCDGLKTSGATVWKLGLITSPMGYFSMFYYPEVAGNLIITGSHNPPEYNGFKISAQQSALYGKSITELHTIIKNEDFIFGEGTVLEKDIFPDYLKKHHTEFGQLKDPGVVVDCGNGVAGVVVRKLYEGCGLKPTFLFEEPDGRFPNHHPDPTVESNLTVLAQKVKDLNATLGIGFDGDADRVGFVNRSGQLIYADEIMVAISRHLLKDKPGSPIIGDVKCSDRMYEAINNAGGRAIMWKTGHSLIKEKVKQENAPFGGELSGHLFFADRNYGYDDAPYAGLRVIEILGQTGLSLEDLVCDLPQAYNTPEIRIDTTEEKKISIVSALKEKYSANTEHYQVNHIDGVRISYSDGWALIRSSNTQPVLVMRFESHSQSGLERIQNEIESLVKPLL